MSTDLKPVVAYLSSEDEAKLKAIQQYRKDRSRSNTIRAAIHAYKIPKS